uniref:Uncharacterized protein n=1 Tax=Anguilla anguilla TaxID=7936 RepID=A0A0E9UC20_ANGAN
MYGFWSEVSSSLVVHPVGFKGFA